MASQQCAACGGLDIKNADGGVARGGGEGGVALEPGDIKDCIVVGSEARIGRVVHLVAEVSPCVEDCDNAFFVAGG